MTRRSVARLAVGVVMIAAAGAGVAALFWPARTGDDPRFQPPTSASRTAPGGGPAAGSGPAAGGPGAGDLAATPDAIATSTGPFVAGPVTPPAQGAFLGAWVRPAVLTQPARVEAVTAWEDTLGRRLDIVNTYRRLGDPFFGPSDAEFAGQGATIMLSWAAGDTRSITGGQYDGEIRARAREAKAWQHPVLIRFRWEMDRPNLRASMWSGADYVAAWRYTREIFREEGADNVSWVWCPTAEGFAGGYAQDFYPGDADVDWACVDVYAGAKFAPLGTLLRPFLRWGAQHPGKPLMLGEFGVARAWASGQRAAWLTNAAAVVQANPQIRAALYFESNPDNADGPHQQFRLADDPTALAAFKSLAHAPYFNPPR